MNLLDLVQRTATPEPWHEGDNIPWHEPGFSERMLQEHLSQQHDMASRRGDLIDRQVAWVHETVLGDETTRVLDLGCGPGLYCERLARLGHECVGIDYSPASIAYAREIATREELACRYTEGDIRTTDYVDEDGAFGLVMLLYGEFNVFRPQDARHILAKAREALTAGGVLLLEPHREDAMRRLGQEGATWHTAESGLFGGQPHLVLSESFWDETAMAATTRYYVVAAETADVTAFAQSFQAYDEAGYREVLADAGFEDVQIHPSLIGDDEPRLADLYAITARVADE
jgi:SAM-dependent methyltransferase